MRSDFEYPVTRRDPRRGITLLEVMISIGIVAISIFGLLALLPIAGQQAERGLIADRASAAGRNAVAEFHAREMARLEVQSGTVIASQWCNGASAAPFPLVAGRSYCIDPMYVTRRVTEGSFVIPNTGFPDVAGVNQMQRVNLRAGEAPPRQVIVPDFTYDAGASTPAGYFVPNGFHYVPASVPGSVSAMGQLQADRIFTAPDDLVFEKNEGQPGSAAVPLPIQQMARDSSNNILLRETEGAFNWMATLVPELPQDSTSYILSIVVFHNRPLVAGQERVAQINDGLGDPTTNTDFYSGGVGGGDVRITLTTSPADVEVRRGQWVLLTPSLAPSNNISYFRWYRVIEADFETDSGGGRAITLDGEDWPVAPDWEPDATRRASFLFPHVIIPPNVVAVYQRTLRFNESTAWYE